MKKYSEIICRKSTRVILMCDPAENGSKSTLAKKFESTGMTILSYDEESFKRGLNEHPYLRRF